MVDLPSVKHSVNMITTSELKSRAIKSSMGVLPLRRSESIPEMNLVHLRGRSVAATGADIADDLATSRVGTNTPRTPRRPAPISESFAIQLPERREPLPAILPMVGTTHTATLQERQAPFKPVIQIPPVKKRKIEVVVIEHEVLQRGTPRSVVNRMVNEARLLSQSFGDRVTPHSRLSSKQQSYRTSSSISGGQQPGLGTPNDDPSRAAVENLIASIKSKQLQEAQRQSDRKIVDIIHRVLGRTIDLVYDEDEKERMQQEQERQKMIEEQSKISIILEEDDRTVTPRGPDISRADVDTNINEEDEDDEEIDGEERTTDGMAPNEDSEMIDMSRDPLYRHILLGISNEDILNVRGTHIDVSTPVFSKNQALPARSTTQGDKSVHHFCIEMLDENDGMPREVRAITQLYHQRARFRHQLPRTSNYHKHGKLPTYPKRDAPEYIDETPSVSHIVQSGTPSIPYTGLMSLESDLNIWQRRATQLVQPTIEGESALSEDPYLIRLWTSAPPKMYLHPRRVKEHLFAKYISPHAKGPLADDDDDEDDASFSAATGLDADATNSVDRELAIDQHAPLPVIRPYKSLERLPSTIDQSEEFQMLPTMIRSAVSCSNLTAETAVRFDSNYAFTLDETKHQTNARKTLATIPSTPNATLVNEAPIIPAEAHESQLLVIDEEQQDEASKEVQYFPKTNRSSLYQQALAEGRPFIGKGRQRAARRARKDEHFWKRIDAIVAMASAPPRQPPLSRRNSFHEALFYERNHPHILKQRARERQASLDRTKHHFEELVKTKYNYAETRVKSARRGVMNEFQWTRELWYSWLDEYIAELDKQETIRQEKEFKATTMNTKPFEESSSSTMKEYDEDEQVDENGSQRAKRVNIVLEPIVNLHLADSEDRRTLENEIHRLTASINRDPRDVFSLTRRGGLLRKLGLFQDALNDLSLAIYIEPGFMDAYWQRALIYMIFGHYDEALDSLNMCIKFNKTHAGAYKLRGDIYALKNDLSLAIANYSQAIRHNPTDHEAHFQRAQTYERRNEILLAMDDYVQVTRLNPKNIEAWYKHAMYYFNTKNYDYAIGDLTELLKRQSDHVSARLHRGLSYFYLEDYQPALADFSATLHYDPSNWAAYYHRACLLRLCNPAKSLQDFSISLLINPEYDNLGSYLHRALIYCQQNQFEEAIADYEAILVLDREHAPALCNLAIIYMKKNVQKALALFTRAIEADPTYVRAYFCRAYFYTQINQLQQAYSDYTKIYHMFPDQNGAMVLRGNILLAMGQLEQASFCVEVAAKLQSSTNPDDDASPLASSSSMQMSASSPQQQAIVHSFLEQFDYALAIMDRECAYHPTAANYRMLGTLRIKAKRFDEARDAFEKCIQVCSSGLTDQKSELYGAYLDLSKCLIQLKRYPQAVDQLSVLLKLQQVNPSAEAYLQRGIAKLRMFGRASSQELAKLSSTRRPLLDINRALVIEPNNAEAYLARAAWYARCERYSKGVLNCNEAIRLSPNLVRAYLYRGCLKYSLRLYNHAIIDLTKALQIDASCSHAYYNRALCHIRLNNLSYAAKDFAIVLSLASGVGNSKTQLLELETYVNRGLVHYEHKDFENALADFEHALDLVVTSNDESKIKSLKHKLIYTIGQCHHRLAQFHDAIEQYLECERTDRASTDMTFRHDLWIAQSNVYMDMNSEKSRVQATKLFERVLHENPLQEQARLNLGYCLRQRGFYQRAWTQFAALLQLHPSHVRALEARALVCLQMNHPKEAFIDLNQALRFEPSSAQLLTNRGVIQQYLGDNRSAMSDYRAAILADPQNAFANYNIGNILMFHGQFIQAIASFDRVLEINPRDEAALTNRAIAKAVLKQYDSAREDLQRALEISPLSAHIHVDLGQLLLTMDEPVRAEEEFSRALEIRPCDPVVFKWRGDARSKQDGKRQAALNDYRICVELNDALQLARKHGLIKGPSKTRRRL